MKLEYVAELRGTVFRGRDAELCVLHLTPGTPLILAREPNNPHDKNAVRVHWVTTLCIGYVQREIAAEIAPFMDRGYMVECVVKTKGHAPLRTWRGIFRRRINPKLFIRLTRPEEEDHLLSVQRRTIVTGLIKQGDTVMQWQEVNRRFLLSIEECQRSFEERAKR